MPAQETRVVTGTAAYRERIALPPDAVFEATLEDVSRADTAAEVIGRTTIERPGQPPIRFSIGYNPARIMESHSYAVRARITVGGDPWFITDQAYPVLTAGSGSDVTLLLRRVSGGANPLGALPASYSGELPCADCLGIRYDLNLFAGRTYFLRMTYIGGSAKPVDDIGKWELDGDILALRGGSEPPERFSVKSGGILQKLDLKGQPIDSQLNYELRRTPAFERIEPNLEMTGLFRYMADAPIFTECLTGERWPVAMEGAYRELESVYLRTRWQPGEDLMSQVTGKVAMRPGAEGGQPAPTLVIERYISIWPGETCGEPSAATSLTGTYWKLTRLEGKPVLLGEGQREPHLIFRAENRVTGNGGCNSLAGGYKMSGAEMTFSGIVATRMACAQGMDIETAFFSALEKVRSWKIRGQHLELYDASGGMVARFEARQFTALLRAR